MVYLDKDPNVLKFQDYPVGYWIGALLAAATGLLLLISMIYDATSSYGISVLSATVTSWLLGVAVYYSWKAPIKKTTVDRNLRIVTIDSKGLFGRNFTSYRYEDVQGGASLRSVVGRRGRMAYWIQLLMKEGKPIDLMTREDYNEGPISEAVDRINEYLGITTAPGDCVPTRFLDNPDEL
jgi:hypothetical protein